MQQNDKPLTNYPMDFILSLPVDVQKTVIYIGELFERAEKAGDTDKFKAYKKGFFAILASYRESFNKQSS
jgi:hypothetical protein